MSAFVQSGRLLLRVLPVVLLIAVFNLSCGNKSKPTEPDQPGVTGVGVLLQGNATDNGVAATINLAPTPAPESDITESHFMKTRLDAALNLTSTVGEINAALNAAGVKIISMTHGMPLVTLVIPSVETKAEADSIGDILEGSGSFLFARGTFTSALSRLPGGSNESAVLPPTGVNHLTALSRIRMPAAWNLKGMATLANAVTAVVPDEYFSKTVHPDIPGQVFLPGGGRISNIADHDGFYTGNHGFNTCGIMGAAFNDIGTTGVHPGPKELLAIQSLTIGGISIRESSEELASRIPEGNCVVNTSYGFYGDFTDTPRLDRILEALYFRIQLAQHSRIGTYLHIAAANNLGLNSDDSRYAAYGSAFNLAAAFDQPSEMIPSDSLTGSDLARFNLLLSSYITTYPNLLTKLQNVIVVGSSDSTGLESTFSNTGSLVRVLGEAVPGPCVKQDANSNPNYCRLSSGLLLANYDGTSMAAPQIAGLAAYLWNINSDLTITQMKAIMYRQFSTSPAVNGFLDAFGCVLALDDNLANANVRKRLVDVVGSDGAPGEDGVFNEKDLLLLYNKFKEFEDLRLNSGTVDKDYSRYDLNGDGYTGDSILQIAFDLDVNSPAAWSTISGEICGASHSYDELQVSDYDVARYYANTALYTGKQAIRDSLTGCTVTFAFAATMPTSVARGGGATLAVSVSRSVNGGTQPQQGVNIVGQVNDGTPLQFNGVTDANGDYSTVITLGSSSDSMVVHVSANYEGRPVDEQTLVVHALAGPSPKLAIVKRISWTAAFAGGNTGGEWHEAFDTSQVAGPSSTVRDNQHSGSNTNGSVSASCTCSRTDSVSILSDSTRMTIEYSFSNAVTATAVSTEDGALWHASGTGIIQQEYLFTVKTNPANFTAAVSNFLEGSDNSLYFRFSLFPAGGNIPILDLEIPGGTTPPPPDTLNTVLPVGNYSVKIVYNSNAAANADNNSVTATTNCLSKAYIEIDTPSGASPHAVGYQKKL